MKLDKTYLLNKMSVLAIFTKRFRFIIVFVIFSSMYAYVLTQVNAINLQQPTQNQINQKATASPKTNVDPKLAEKILSLEDQNIQIKTLFSEARKNPFNE